MCCIPISHPASNRIRGVTMSRLPPCLCFGSPAHSDSISSIRLGRELQVGPIFTTFTAIICPAATHTSLERPRLCMCYAGLDSVAACWQTTMHSVWALLPSDRARTARCAGQRAVAWTGNLATWVVIGIVSHLVVYIITSTILSSS